MTEAHLLSTVEDFFESRFGSKPQSTAYAPGRVNLLGEHTDYNGGLVLPMPLALGTAVAIGPGGDAGRLEVASTSFDGVETRGFDEAATGSWTDYVLGTFIEFFAGNLPSSGVRMAITSDLPVGSGLSSSAALEIATLRAAGKAFGVDHDPVEMAKLARKAENGFVGMPCGIMDQFSVSVGTPGSAVFLNTRTLESRIAALPDSHNFVVIHSGVSHKLTQAGYAERVKECAAACKQLGVEMLSDLGLDELPKINALPAPLDGRARHIVTENDRVRRAVDALAAQDARLFARLMTESHHSQRDDYEVSVAEVDALVDGALAAGADGARLTGGGFGGSVVAFVETARVPAFRAAIEDRFPDARVLAVT